MLSEVELEFAQLNHRWKLICELFANDQNIELLNKSGAHIFSLFQKLTIDEVMMALCRISDPPKTCGKSNNSLKFYFEQRKGQLDAGAISKLDDMFGNLDNFMINIRKMRNLAISHSDHEVATKITNLPNISYDEIESTMELICKILNKIFDTRGKYMPATRGSAKASLLKILSYGLKVQEANTSLNTGAAR